MIAASIGAMCLMSFSSVFITIFWCAKDYSEVFLTGRNPTNPSFLMQRSIAVQPGGRLDRATRRQVVDMPVVLTIQAPLGKFFVDVPVVAQGHVPTVHCAENGGSAAGSLHR